VADLLGRPPRCDFEVVTRDQSGRPAVIRNHPFERDGTPMPTRYWLLEPNLGRAIDRLEAAGGIRAAEGAVDPAELAASHASYAADRDRDVPADWAGPRPSGGVGGTRRGVKCLHAHYAWYLAGGPDPVGKWVAGQLSSPAAAIDCGTNSTRLLVAYPHGPILERLQRITRLGQGVDRTRRLAPDAIRRTLDVLQQYRGVMDHHGVAKVRMTATSAARDALNRDDFFSAAEEVVGTRPELLAGDAEGRLSFTGATSQLDPSTAPWLVVDIGGGSTELVVGPAPETSDRPAAVRSLDVGCVRVSERFLLSDPPTDAEISAARRFSAELLQGAIRSEQAFSTGRTLVGLAGTVSCLASIDQGLEAYDRDRVHHYHLTLDRVTSLVASLARVTAAERRMVPGMESDRADVIVGGTVILEVVMRTFGFAECLTSEADILDGLILSTAP
jgi:exopolyphosphatase / guanosine-5'-triphosphate,3'-diphosphate pyrophosphatase